MMFSWVTVPGAFLTASLIPIIQVCPASIPCTGGGSYVVHALRRLRLAYSRVKPQGTAQIPIVGIGVCDTEQILL